MGIRVFALCDSYVSSVVSDYLQDEYMSPGNPKLLVERSEDPHTLCEFSYSAAQSGLRSLCVIGENCAANIRKCDVKSAMCFVITCDELNASILKYMIAEGIPTWIPSSVNELYETVSDAALLSELLSVPSLILLQNNLTEAGERIYVQKKYDIDVVRKTGSKEKREILRKILSKYNRVEGKGKTILLGYGEDFDRAVEMSERIDGITILKITFCYLNTLKSIERIISSHERIISFCGLVADSKAFICKNHDRRDEEIRSFLAAKFDEKQKRKLRYIGPSVKRPELIKPDTPKTHNIMCPGCIYREKVLTELKKSNNAVVYEKVFCKHRNEYVTAGITRNVLSYEQEGIMKVRQRLDNAVVIKVVSSDIDSSDCKKCSAGRVYVTYKCDGCLDCIEQTGCPAIWNKGFVTRIDPMLCTGCGLCIKTCTRGGLDWTGISLYAGIT